MQYSLNPIYSVLVIKKTNIQRIMLLISRHIQLKRLNNLKIIFGFWKDYSKRKQGCEFFLIDLFLTLFMSKIVAVFDFAPPGKIAGRITDAATGEALPFGYSAFFNWCRFLEEP